MPLPRKPDHLRQRGKRTPSLSLVGASEERIVPRMPVGRWLKGTRQAWDDLFSSDIAEVIQPIDGTLLLHWLRCVDERERAYRLFVAERMVEGSRGQPRISPAWKLYQDLSMAIGNAEQQLGIGGLNRFRLGLTMGQAHQAMNAVMGDEAAELIEIDDDVIEASAQ